MGDNSRESGNGASGSRWMQVALLVLGFGGLVVLVVLWNTAPDYVDAKDPASAVATTRAGILTAMAGLLAFTGVMLSVAQTRRTNEQTRIRDEETRDRDRDQLDEIRTANKQTRDRDRLSHDREMAEQRAQRYTDAITQLGSDTLNISLGGIYALERLTKYSPDDQPTVVEVLSAFVRDRSADPALRAAPVRPAADVHAAVTVLARLPVLDDGVPRADLVGADLTGPAALTRLQAKEGNLSGVDLDGAKITPDAKLDKLDLTRASLKGTDFTGARMDGAILRGAWLQGTEFTGATLNGAILKGATLDRTTILDGAWLDGVDLTEAKGLTQEQVNAARGDGRTRLPDDLVRPASWGPEAPRENE